MSTIGFSTQSMRFVPHRIVHGLRTQGLRGEQTVFRLVTEAVLAARQLRFDNTGHASIRTFLQAVGLTPGLAALRTHIWSDHLTRVSAPGARRADTAGMVETIEGWRCIGCGKVDAPRPCVGICQDKRVELVLAEDYAEMAWRVEQLQGVLALIAHTTPKPDKLEASWLALQARARTLLESGSD